MAIAGGSLQGPATDADARCGGGLVVGGDGAHDGVAFDELLAAAEGVAHGRLGEAV